MPRAIAPFASPARSVDSTMRALSSRRRGSHAVGEDLRREIDQRLRIVSAREVLDLFVDGLDRDRANDGCVEDQRLPIAARIRAIAARVLDLRLVIEREIAKRMSLRQERREFCGRIGGLVVLDQRSRVQIRERPLPVSVRLASSRCGRAARSAPTSVHSLRDRETASSTRPADATASDGGFGLRLGRRRAEHASPLHALARTGDDRNDGTPRTRTAATR